VNDTIGNIVSQLSQKDSRIFQELTHIGHLTHTFQWANYEFTIKTLTIDEEVAIGQLIKHLDKNVIQEKALVVGIVAASLVSINGKYPFPETFVEDSVTKLRENYRYISENWHWPVVAKINEQYIILQEKMYKSLQELENLSQEGRLMSLETSIDSFAPSKDHPFLAGEDPTNFE
jgi:hypothetical protein